MMRNQELIEARHVMQGTLSLGKCIVNIVKWHIVEILRLVLMPLRAGNYYLMKAEVLYELFKELDKKSFEQSR
jgi:hypothetical protein